MTTKSKGEVLTISNLLSFLRGPLALFFLIENPIVRAVALVCAMVTDGLDGFLARRYRKTSQFGAFLDPVMDKFFALFVLLVFLAEGKLHAWQVCVLLSRDFAVAIFGFYLVLSGHLAKYQFQAIWSGKITTAFQFALLMVLTLGYSIPTYAYSLFVGLGCVALIELSLMKRYSEGRT